VKEEHVADGTVRDGWAEDRDPIYVSPVADAGGVVDPLTHPPDHLGVQGLREEEFRIRGGEGMVADTGEGR
jgi:hypothetical protein